MRVSIRLLAILAAVLVVGTLWFVAAFAAGGGLSQLLTSGLIGLLTIVGWMIALVVGPVASIQLWRFRESGRRAGIVLFGSGLVYYGVGLVVLRTPHAPIAPIIAAATMYAAPLFLLLSRRANPFFTASQADAAH